MFTEYVVLVSAMLGKDAEMMQLRQRESVLIFALDPSNTFPTSAIEQVFVSPAASKKVGLTLALGVCAGLVFGVLALFLRSIFRNTLATPRHTETASAGRRSADHTE